MKKKVPNFRKNDFDLEINTEETLKIRRPNKLSVQIPKKAASSLFETKKFEENVKKFDILPSKTPQKDVSPQLLAVTNKIRKNTFVPNILKLGRPPSPTSLLNKKKFTVSHTAAFKIQEERELQKEKNQIAFTEDPKAYFKKHEFDGTGQQFIYMVLAKDRSDPEFSPYDLKKVVFQDVGDDYYTMSAKGVTHVDNKGNTDYIDIDLWTQEGNTYSTIRKLNLFKLYHVWKPFRLWRIYIHHQRFNDISKLSLEIPFLLDKELNELTHRITRLMYDCEKEISHLLLPFFLQRKLKITDFVNLCNENMETIKKIYREFIESVGELINELFLERSDPSNLEVHDTDFAENNRVHPNIQQLMILEKKKYADKKMKVQKMDVEIRRIVEYIRKIDYMILEFQRNMVFNVFGKSADLITADASEAFQIDVTYKDGGEVTFSPSIDDLIETTRDMFEKVIDVIYYLPRIYVMPQLSEVFNFIGCNPGELFANSGTLEDFMSCSTFIDDTIKRIFDQMRKSYEAATILSHVFTEYYPLYKLGQTWDIKEYIRKMDGSLYERTLSLYDRPFETSDVDFLIHPENEPVINLNKISNDIDFLKDSNAISESIRGGATCGIFYVDSLLLRSKLAPIPKKSLSDLENLLNEFVELKVELLLRLFKNYKAKLKNDSTTLACFTSICTLLNNIESLLPKINKELSYINDIQATIESSGFKVIEYDIHDKYKQFKKEYDDAVIVKTYNTEKYQNTLKVMVSDIEKRLSEGYLQSRRTPESIKKLNLNDYKEIIDKTKSLVAEIQPKIEECQSYQQIFGVEVSQFVTYKEILSNIEFCEDLYKLLCIWNDVNNQIVYSQFKFISIDKFEKDFNDASECIENIHKKYKRIPGILIEIEEVKASYQQYLPQIRKLLVSNLNEQHWNQIFTETGKKEMYKPTLTLKELVRMGIMSNINSINNISDIAKGQDDVATKYKEICNKWDFTKIPLDKYSISDPLEIKLLPIDQFTLQIEDAIIQLEELLTDKYSELLSEDIEALRVKLNNAIDILREWWRFQTNWRIIYTLFKDNSLRQILNPQYSTFAYIKSKFIMIARNALDNPYVLNATSANNINSDMENINFKADEIMVSLSELAESKRKISPRFCLLSDYEIITMITTNDFNIFMPNALKLFMYIAKFDYRIMQEKKIESSTSGNFSSHVIFSAIGDDNDPLPLDGHILCNGSVEMWLADLQKMLSGSFLTNLRKSIQSFSSKPICDWNVEYSTYICLFTLLCWFTESVDNCFSNLASNPKVFNRMKSYLLDLINEMMDSYKSVMGAEYKKTAMIIGILHTFVNIVDKILTKNSDFSPQLMWKHHLKVYFNKEKHKITFNYDNESYEHIGEYWGDATSFMITESTNKTLSNILFTMGIDRIPLLFSKPGSGATTFIKTMAMTFGNFLYNAPAFYNENHLLIARLLKGAIKDGFWIHFMNSERLSYSNNCFITDSIRNLMERRGEGAKTVIIDEEEIKIKPSVYVFMSTSNEALKNRSLPPQLISYARQVAFNTPPIHDLILIRLQSLGFKSTNSSSAKLTSLLYSLEKTFQFPDSIHHIAMFIINKAYNVLEELAHSTNVSFLDQNGDIKVIEEYALALSVYQYFNKAILYSRIDILIQQIHSSFLCNWAFDVLKNRLDNATSFSEGYSREIISTLGAEYLKKTGEELPIDYLTDKLVRLVGLLQMKSCVILSGPPNSGKSLLIKTLDAVFKAIPKSKKIPNIGCLDTLFIEKIYHNSLQWNEIFGTIKDKKWEFGLIEPTLYYLEYSKSIPTHKILIFDGSMTPEFVNFIDQAVSNNYTLCLTTGASYSVGIDFHIIIETNNIATVDPKLITRCAVLSMDNVQTPELSISSKPICKLPRPEIPFTRCALEFKDMFTDEELATIKVHYCDIVPNVIRYISALDALISIKFNSDPVAYDIAVVTMLYIKEYKLDPLKRENVRNALVICSFTVCDSFLTQKDSKKLDDYLTKEFVKGMPVDWRGLNALDEFWDVYQRPSISNVRLYRGNFIPMQHEILQLPLKRLDKDEKLFKPENLMIPFAQNIRQLNTVNMCLKYKRNIIVYGERGSGKSCFIRKVLANNRELTPIYITVTSCTKSSHIIRQLMDQTDIITSKKKLEKETICLIFENVEYYNTDVIDLIRELIDQKELQIYSHIDQKVYKKLNVNNFITIIETSSIEKLSPRFASNFIVTKISALSKTGKSLFVKKILEEAEVNQDLASLTAKIISDLNCTLFQTNTILLPLCNIYDRNGRTHQTKVSYIRVLLSEIFINYFYCDNVKFKAMFKKWENCCLNLGLEKVFKAITVNPTISLAIYNNEKIEVRDYDDAFVRSKLGEYVSNALTEQNLYNYVMFDHSLKCPKHHCIVIGQSAVGQLYLIKVFAQIANYEFIDIARNERNRTVLLKQSIEDCLFNHKVTLIFARVTQNDEDLFSFLVSVFIKGTVESLFNNDEIVFLAEKMVSKQLKTKESLNEAIKKLKTKVKENVHLAILTEDQYEFMKLNNYFDFITVTQPSPQMFCKQYLDNKLNVMSKAIISIIDSISDLLPFTHPDQFHDLMDVYTRRVKEKELENEKQLKYLNDSKVFFDDVKELITTTKEKLNNIDEDKMKLSIKNTNVLTTLKKKNEKIERKKTIIDEEMMLRNVQVREKADLLMETEERKRMNVPKLDMTEEMIPKLRELCISLDPNVIAVKETIFEIIGTREIDQNFINRINSVDLDSLNMDMFKRLLISLNENPFFYKEMEDPMSKLAEYVLKAMKYAKDNQKHQQLRMDLTERQESMQLFNMIAEEEYQSIEKDEKEKKTYDKMLESINHEQSHLEVTTKKLTTKLETLENIMRDINLVKDKVIEMLKICEKRSVTLFSDELIYSIYIVYCGMMQKKERIELLDLVANSLNTKHFETMYDQPLNFVEEQLMDPEGIKPMQYIPASLRIEISHIFKAPKTPLIIDPDRITLRTIKESFKCLTVSMHSNKFNHVLKKAIKNGMTFIALDVDDLTGNILNLLSQSNSTDVIIVNSEIVRVRKGFRTLLFTNHNVIQSIPSSLLSRTTLIDCSEASSEALENSFVKDIMMHFDAELFNKVIYAADSQKKIDARLEECIQKVIKTCSVIEQKIYDGTMSSILDDNNLITQIINARDVFVSTITNMPNFDDIAAVFKHSTAHFSDITEMIKIFWCVLARKMPLVNPIYRFSLDEFMQLIENILTTSNTKLEEVSGFKQHVIQTITQWVYPSLAFPDLVFFLFTLGFESKKIPSKEFDMIIEHINQERMGSIGYIAPDLAPNSIVENLKYASCETFFQLITHFVQNNFGNNYLNAISIFSVEQLFNSPPFLPTLVFPTDYSDPSDIISDYVSIRSLTDKVISVSLVDDEYELKILEKAFNEISKEDKVLILHYSKPSTNITSMLYGFVTASKSENSVSSKFRLVIICNTSKYIPSSMLESTRKIVVDNFVSPRKIVNSINKQSVMMITSQLGENIYFGKILILLSFLFAQMRLRSLIHPLCFTEQIPFMSELDIRAVIEIISWYFIDKNEQLTQQVPMKNIKVIIGEILFLNNTINPVDSKRIECLLSLMLSVESIKDGFTFCDKNRNAGDAHNWSLPPNGPFSQMYQTVSQRLCVIPTIDGAAVNSTTSNIILQLNLSKLIMQPFISVFRKTKSRAFFDKTTERFYLGQIPEEIQLQMSTNYTTFEKDFWLSEAKKYNDQITVMRETVNDKDVVRSLGRLLTPEKWRTNKCEPTNITEFIAFQKSRRDFLNRAVNVPNTDLTEIQAAQIYDIRGLLMCFLTTSAYKRKEALDTMELHFLATDDKISDSIALNNIYIMGSDISFGDKLSARPKRAFAKINRLVVKAEKIVPITSKTFMTPLYNAVDGKFVYNMKLYSEESYKTLLLDGITVFCSLPSQLKP